MNARIKILLENFSALNGTKFVGIREYISVKSGEVANFVVNANFSYQKAVATTIAILKSLTSADFDAIARTYNVVNEAGTQYGTNKGAVEFLETGKLPKEGTAAREKVLAGVKETKTLATICAEMVTGFTNNQNDETRSAQSVAQSEAYTHITKGVKQHKETLKYHIWAMAHSKDVLIYGVYADSNPQIETLQKNAIERYCKDVLNQVLPVTKYRNFVVEENQLSEVRVNGEAVEFLQD